MTRAYFLSDIHLKTAEERNSQILLRFFRFLAESDLASRPSHLFLVGDIFDLWVGSHRYFVRRFEPLIAALRSLRELGIEIHFFEGNHDLHLHDFWQGEMGFHVHTDARYFQLAGKMVRIEHGDLINPEDKGYLFLRRFLRTSLMKTLALNLPALVVKTIGERASRASRDYTSTAKELPHDNMVAMVRRHAETAFLQKPFDLIISGHVHAVDDHSFHASHRMVRSINLGHWGDGPKTFLLTEAESRFVDLSDLVNQ